MVQPVNMAAKTTEPRGSEAALAAGQRWENEGGAIRDASEIAAMAARAMPLALSRLLLIQIHAAQAHTGRFIPRREETLSAKVGESAAPSLWGGVGAWRWRGICSIGVVVVMAVWWITVVGFSLTAVLQGLLYGTSLVLLGFSPVLVSELVQADDGHASRTPAPALRQIGSIP